MKYFLYARKSTESDEKQIQSIPDQINYWNRRIDSNIQIVDTLSEEKSAKLPNTRKKFYEMLDRIKIGEADGILCWKLDRLSRNPDDSGKVQGMLQRNEIKKIITSDREYLPTDSGLIFSVETGMANQFILDLSKNVSRGMNSKYEDGQRPTIAPQGYLNDKIHKTNIIDPDRFHLVQKMWKLMLTGNYVPSKILNIANKEWGYRTRLTKKTGGNPLVLSGIYKIFHNIYYTGYCYREGKLIKLKHEPMITLDEFDRVQILLGKKGNPRAKTREFAYTGIIRCSDCGCKITAEEKLKYIKSTSKTKKYIYYHCTHRKDNSKKKCSQRDSVEEKELEKQINEQLSSITIVPEFLEWALKILKERHSEEISDRQVIYENLNRTLEDEEKKRDRLTDLLIKELISDEEFKTKKKEIEQNIISLQNKRDNTEYRATNWNELTENTFHFATYAQRNFNNGDLQTKKEIFNALGQNFFMKDGKLSLELNKWFIPIQNHKIQIEREYQGLEPTKNSIDMLETDAIKDLIPSWFGMRDSNPR